MISVESYFIPKKNSNNLPIDNEVGNISLLYANNYDIITKLKKIQEKKHEILKNCHKYIDYYIYSEKNIFSEKIKFSNNSLLKQDNIYLAIKTSYIFDKICVELFLLNSLPHIMINKEFYFEYSSLLKKINKIFNISDSKYSNIFKQDLHNILYDVFDITFLEMVKNC